MVLRKYHKQSEIKINKIPYSKGHTHTYIYIYSDTQCECVFRQVQQKCSCIKHSYSSKCKKRLPVRDKHVRHTVYMDSFSHLLTY